MKNMKKILTAVVLAALVAFAAPAFAASNPFADVPAGHWAYDAVALLASRGVISGYPDGQYKGGQLATRYEMASIVARALVYVDEGKASKEDVELVKKLCSEFKNELDALGVKVADLDKRVAGLEKGLKGLRIKGIFWLDAEWGGADSPYYGATETTHGTQPSFSYGRARFFVEKQVDANTFFQMRVNVRGLENKGDNFRVDRLWFSTKLPWDIKGTFGYQTTDWDSEYGLWDAKYGGWGAEDSFFTNLKFMGFDFRKDWGQFDVDVYVGRNTQSIDSVDRDYYFFTGKAGDQDYMTYGAKVGYKGEKLKLGVFFRGSKMDGAGNNTPFSDIVLGSGRVGSFFNYGAYAKWIIVDGVELKGTYNHQEFRHDALKGNVALFNNISNLKNADYWQAALELDQSFLKVASLWVQYGRVGQGFIHNPDAFNFIGYQPVLWNFSNGSAAVTDYEFGRVALHRDFTKKFQAYAGYMAFRNKNDFTKVSRTWDFSIGFKYQYTPAVAFQLQYDWRDYGNNEAGAALGFMSGKEDMFRFRTILSF